MWAESDDEYWWTVIANQKLGHFDLVYWVYRSSCFYSCPVSWASQPVGCLLFYNMQWKCLDNSDDWLNCCLSSSFLFSHSTTGQERLHIEARILAFWQIMRISYVGLWSLWTFSINIMNVLHVCFSAVSDGGVCCAIHNGCKLKGSSGHKLQRTSVNLPVCPEN